MSKPQPRTFLQRVREAYTDIHKRSPTQVQIAAIAKVTQPSVSDWDKPNTYPAMATAVVLARKLNVSVEWLLTERGPKRIPPIDSEAQQLWTAYSGLDDRRRSRLLAYAVGLTDAGSEEPGPAAGEIFR